MKSIISSNLLSSSAVTRSGTVQTLKLKKSGSQITIGDTWKIKLPESDEWAASRKKVGLTFNVVITEIYKNGDFTGISLDGSKVVTNVYGEEYLNKLVHKSAL